MKIDRKYVWLIEQFSFKAFQYNDIKTICESINEIDNNDLFKKMIDVCVNTKRNRHQLMLPLIDEYIKYFNSKFSISYYTLLNLYDKIRLMSGINSLHLTVDEMSLNRMVINLFKEKISNEILVLLNEDKCTVDYNIFIECFSYEMLTFIKNYLNNNFKPRNVRVEDRVYDFFHYKKKNGIQLDDDIRKELTDEMFNYAYQIYLDNKEICEEYAKAHEEYQEFREKEYYNNWGFDDTCRMSDEEYQEELEYEKEQVDNAINRYYLITTLRLIKLGKKYNFDMKKVLNKIIDKICNECEIEKDVKIKMLEWCKIIYKLSNALSDNYIKYIDDVHNIDVETLNNFKDLDNFIDELDFYLSMELYDLCKWYFEPDYDDIESDLKEEISNLKNRFNLEVK